MAQEYSVSLDKIISAHIWRIQNIKIFRKMEEIEHAENK